MFEKLETMKSINSFLENYSNLEVFKKKKEKNSYHVLHISTKSGNKEIKNVIQSYFVFSPDNENNINSWIKL